MICSCCRLLASCALVGSNEKPIYILLLFLTDTKKTMCVLTAFSDVLVCCAECYEGSASSDGAARPVT